MSTEGTRVGWHEYFLTIAKFAAQRSTCNRKHVGAVITRDNVILSTGYNGSVKGAAHCDDVGHLMVEGHCCRTVHAEQNAIAQSARNGICIANATIYTTASPCLNCFKLIANSGIVQVIYEEFYRDDRVFDLAKEVGIGIDCFVPGVTDAGPHK